MAGVRGCQRRGDPVPRVGSTIGNSCDKLSWGNTKCVYASDNHSCFSNHGSSLLNRIRLACQSPIMLAKRQILSFDKAGIDRRTRRQHGQERGNTFSVSKHDFVVDRHHVTPFARLDHLGIAQLFGGNAPWMGVWAPRATPWRLIPFSIHMQQRGAVFRQLVAGKKGDQVRGDIRDPLQQQIGFSLRALADDKGHDEAPLWGKGHPDPGIAIGVTVGFRPREMLVFRMDKAPQFVQLALSDGQLLP